MIEKCNVENFKFLTVMLDGREKKKKEKSENQKISREKKIDRFSLLLKKKNPKRL